MKKTEYQKSIIELIDYVVEQNNGDKNKISLGGHSIGATDGYKIISRFPNYFFAFVPISGKADRVVDTNGNILDDAYETLKDLNILSLCGNSDMQKSNYQTSKKLAEDMRQVNSNVYFVPLKGDEHNIQSKVFVNDF